MPNYEDLPYRPCAGLCVINRKGLVFIGRRADGPEHVARRNVTLSPRRGTRVVAERRRRADAAAPPSGAREPVSASP